ncbi:UNVERIFIED_CONTAM: hypothetical protein FKN15_035034 [Acipenser sinensis]
MRKFAFAPLRLAVSWPTLLLALASAVSSSPSGPASDTCTTLVQGKFFGYFSSSSVFPYSNGGASASPCSWIIQNPDPRRYTLYMKVSKPTSCCNPRLVRTFQYDSFLETTRTYLGMESFDEVLKLCDTSTRHAFLQSGKQFLQMKKLVSRDEPSSALAGNGEFMAEYLVVGNRNPSLPACQMLCKWLENCLVSSTVARPCGIMQTPCQCWDVPPRKQDSCYRGGIYLENCIPSVKESNRDAEIAGEKQDSCYRGGIYLENCIPSVKESNRDAEIAEPHEICEEENYAKVVWKKTPSGEAATVRCPPNASGLILRKCTLDEEGIAYWEPPTYMKCVSNDYRNIQIATRDHLSKAQRGLIGDGVSDIIRNLMELSQDGTSYSGDLLAIMDVLKNMTEIFRRAYYTPKAVDLQKGPNTKELFRLVEDFIDVIGFRMKDFRDSYQVTENLDTIPLRTELFSVKSVHTQPVLPGHVSLIAGFEWI